jgi:hypothetical protein
MERSIYQHGYEDAQDRGYNASGMALRNLHEYMRGYGAGEYALKSKAGDPMTTPTTPIAASVVDFLKKLCSALQAERDLGIGYEALFAEHFPGTRVASPTAPRAEGGETKYTTDDLLLIAERRGYDEFSGDGKVIIPWIRSLPIIPPRDRCEVGGGTRIYNKAPAYIGWPCPRCTKETTCESGSGSSVSSEGTTASDQSQHGTHAPTVQAAASDPATVAGEGPYRVEGKYGCIAGMSHVFAPFNHHNLRDENDVPGYRTRDIVAWMNHAHRTALAGREAEVVRLRKALAHIARMRDEGCGCSPVCKCSEPASLEIFRDTVTDIARDALKGDAR